MAFPDRPINYEDCAKEWINEKYQEKGDELSKRHTSKALASFSAKLGMSATVGSIFFFFL
jgi:hypothetical protein